MDLARYLPPPDASYTAEEVRVHGLGRYSLAGTLTLPTRGRLKNGRILRYPAVVLISGAGKQDRDGVAAGDTAQGALAYRPLYDLADALTRRGLAVLRLDDRGVGASTGSLDSATTLDRADDSRAAVEYLRRRAEVDPHRIALLGMSEGASIAARVASTDPEVRAIVLMAGPAAPGREIALWQRRTRLAADPSVAPAGREPELTAQMAEWDARAHVDPWFRFFATYDPRVTARQVAASALVLQGDSDDTVPPAGADELAQALRTSSRDVTVRHFAGIGHAFVRVEDLVDGGSAARAPRVSVSVCATIEDWLAPRLGGPIEGPAPQASRRRHRHHRH